MKEHAAFAPQKQIRRRFWRFVAATIVVFAVVWILAAVEFFTGFRVFRFANPSPAERTLLPIILFYGAISAVLLIVGAVLFWREWRILSRGIIVSAKVLKRDKDSFAGGPIVVVRYMVDGTEFESSLSVSDKQSKLLEIDSLVDIVVDAKAPRRCTIANM